MSRVAKNKVRQGYNVSSKTYLQSAGALVLPIEDFYPGCVCAIGQMLPGDLDVEKITEAASVGMRNPQIAALVGTTTETLVKHYSKTIAGARAQHAMQLLQLVNIRAADMDEGKKFDMQALSYLLDRQDPEPEKVIAIRQAPPLPIEIFNIAPGEMTKMLKHNKENKQ